MKRKTSIIKAYRRKWRRLPRKDQVFVIKFLTGAFLILVVIIVLLCLLITRIVQGAEGGRQAQAESVPQEIAPAVYNHALIKVQDVIIRENNSENAENTDELPDSEEANLLARLVYAEAGNDSDETQIAVASVILNRVASDSYPNTIIDVIYQEGQYPSVTSGAIDQEPDERAKKNALYVYQNGSQIPSNVLYQSGAIQGSGLWAQLDGEYFCYE
ncbi:MAG: cell wall hydrolase [Eubacteriales bacterium]|nr:cell wall hydrolase [Eubacteriales bacterium]